MADKKHIVTEVDRTEANQSYRDLGKGFETGDGEEAAQLSPIERIAAEAIIVAGGDSVIKLRKIVDEVYPKDSGKEESMRFLAALTRLRQATEVAYQVGFEIHSSIMNTH